ncbi:hypothetical protein SAMN02745135_01135 [Caloranaerobacter azorensis DSM 13643]|uniref:Uncharacterized protein n=1 Tax=Caloranaerobacter azorensis DSM 13643 TaxID=1121264 RepID=A0A1M5TU91_9FIRM|nr:hypothetical protein [Caloranaerobacter azorensis]SHH54241.1 hypothetical protein SAMN02745135_01135 [Caloranaerobacter azorensis DSM 13643]
MEVKQLGLNPKRIEKIVNNILLELKKNKVSVEESFVVFNICQNVIRYTSVVNTDEVVVLYHNVNTLTWDIPKK